MAAGFLPYALRLIGEVRFADWLNKLPFIHGSTIEARPIDEDLLNAFRKLEDKASLSLPIQYHIAPKASQPLQAKQSTDDTWRILFNQEFYDASSAKEKIGGVAHELAHLAAGDEKGQLVKVTALKTSLYLLSGAILLGAWHSLGSTNISFSFEQPLQYLTQTFPNWKNLLWMGLGAGVSIVSYGNSEHLKEKRADRNAVFISEEPEHVRSMRLSLLDGAENPLYVQLLGGHERGIALKNIDLAERLVAQHKEKLALTIG